MYDTRCKIRDWSFVSYKNKIEYKNTNAQDLFITVV